eukprot:CAMPEP_0197597380 /NCGR_PEP_ID=MMETSP1326-20131121/27231_1 /TAXON_ID=1155430 /ORGANISM="Genus nov. species nov., Strain RCC2288" /LENGTH=118 /DNA_ID=CAMNT_0043164051 /DNA_START=23 /DNA_END=376 /DNA_ORIENTATION=-
MGTVKVLPEDLAWLPAFVTATYFLPCPHHAKGEPTNNFALSTRQTLCPQCATGRRATDCIQIRRSSYHNVVRVQDVCKMFDVGGIQTYVINSARVVFLGERPHPRGSKGAGAAAAGGA